MTGLPVRLAVACYLALRVAIAATLAYAVLPEAWFVATAAAIDAVAALGPKRRRVLAYEAGARVVLLWFAHRQGAVLDGRAHAGETTWVWGRLGVVFIAFAPLAIGVILRSLLLDPWTNPLVPDAGRSRRSHVANGCCLVTVSWCVPQLIRSSLVRNLAIAGALVGVGFLAAGAIRTMPRATSELSAYRSAPLPSVPPQRLRLALFALLSVSAAVMFDAACWHGNGWIPARHALAGDMLRAPILHPEDHLVEWIAPFDPPTHIFWETDHARFESARDHFVRLVKKKTPPKSLVLYLPAEAWPAECDHVLWKDSSNLREHERERVVDPHIRDARLHFVCRRRDGELGYCFTALDGASTGCSPS